MLMSTRMIAFILYANENGLRRQDAFGGSVVQSIPGSFSTHLRLALFKLLHKLSRMVRLLISA